MNEVEKMYKLANIKAKEYCDRDSDACMNCCPEWENRQNCWKYKSAMPLFTAEKQLELIKWLLEKWMVVRFVHNLDGIYYISLFDNVSYTGKNLEECIASFVNNAWQDLTEEEKQQVKGILK